MLLKCIAFLVAAILIVFPSIANAQIGISSADSQKTQQMKSIEGNIGYIELMRPAERYAFNVNFLPPDGISKVEGLEITFMGDFASETIFSVNFNGMACNPDRWTTPKSASSNYEMSFSCDNNVNEAKDINSFRIDISADQEVRNVIGWFKVNYESDWSLPSTIAEGILKPSITMHGTEYEVGDNGKIWLQLLNPSGVVVDNGTCYVNVYYPFGAKFVTNAGMMHTENGIYEYNIVVPQVTGVYPATATCYYTTSTQTETADNGYVAIGVDSTGSYAATLTKNNAYWNIDEALLGITQRLLAFENFTGITPPAQQTQFSIDFQGRWDGGTDVITMGIYNWTSGTWIDLPNKIPDTGAVDLDVSNSILTTNATLSGLTNGTSVRIRFMDSADVDVTSSRLRIDYLAVNFIYLSSQTNVEVRGSSELHVSSKRDSGLLLVNDGCEYVTFGKASTCGNVVNSTFADYIEGEIEINLTVTSLISENDTYAEWDFWTPITHDCTSLYYVRLWDGSSWIDITGSIMASSEMTSENCHIKVPIILNIDGSYQYTILLDNYFLWETKWVEDHRKLQYDFLYPQCAMYANIYSYAYEVPITESTFVNESNKMLSSCHRFLDDQYWMSYYYNQSLTETNVAGLTSDFMELRWYESALRHYYTQTNFILNNATLALSYAMPSSVWNHPSRTLTDYNQTLTHSLLQQINGNVISVNATIINANQSIMGKLYMIQEDLDNLLNNLTLQLANVSNITINMTGDLSMVANDVWQLFFQRGTPPLAPSTDYYCSPTYSNVLIKNITYNYKGVTPIAGYFSKEEAVLCSYGCVNRTLFIGHAECDIDPTTKYGLAIGVAILVIVGIALIWKYVIVED